MAGSDLSLQDRQTLMRLIGIRANKEHKLRRELQVCRQRQQALQQQQLQSQQQRQQLLTSLDDTCVPTQALTPAELMALKSTSVSRYQQERALAARITQLCLEQTQLESTMADLSCNILQLVKAQEKLQAVCDE